VVVSNKALEEFLERLLRWDELCAQLKELYYKYLDLAAFRSEKCYFPGRKCKRPWKREYDVGDLTLMWTYIANTAPLCGKLIRALAEVEYKIRKRALESLEKYGGVTKEATARSKIVYKKLNKPVYAYLILWNDQLYVIWGKLYGVRAREAKVISLISGATYKKGSYEVLDVKEDDEYRRLWLEVALPNAVSKILGEKSKAPIALFRNLGWLLSDDVRNRIGHGAGNFGQIALRLFDWIALARYAIDVMRIAPNVPLVFKLSALRVNKTKKGYNPVVVVRPIGTTAKLISTVYKWFEIKLGEPETVLIQGYALLEALRKEAFKREGKVYVVDDVSAWIAFSNVVNTLVIGDGYITPVELGVLAKETPSEIGVKKLAEATNGTANKRRVILPGWYMRLLLPIGSAPIFEKAVKLYKTLVNYPVAALIKLNGVTYLLTNGYDGKFVIGARNADLVEVLRKLNLDIKIKHNMTLLKYNELIKLAKYDIDIRLMNELEKELIGKRVKPVLPYPDPETLKKVLDEVAKIARIVVGLRRGREYVRVIPYDKAKIHEIANMLRMASLNIFIPKRSAEIWIYETTSVEAIRSVAPHLFSTYAIFKHGYN